MDNAALKVVLVGGSGFLGRGLRALLVRDGHRVSVIGRGPSADHHDWEHVHWDARTPGPWTAVLDDADVIVHLAGKRVDCRPTRSNMDELIASREGTVRLVGQAIRHLDKPPSAWVQLSSLAIYGDSGDTIIDESTPTPTTGLRQQVEVCQRWEAAYEQATAGLQRTVLLRPAIGIGGNDDPATRQLARLARLGLGGTVGSGQQWVSWIAAEDFYDLLHRAVTDTSMAGLYHLSAPNPVRNRELMAAYRNAVGRSFGMPSPAAIVKLGAALLGSDPSLALTGRRCIPRRLLDEGHTFSVTNIDEAVRSAIAAAT